jgi:hypothetical protein
MEGMMVKDDREPKPKPAFDDQLAAVATIAQALIPFDEDVRRRIFAAVLCLFDEERANSALQGPP